MVRHDWKLKVVALVLLYIINLPISRCQDYEYWYDEDHRPPRIQDLPDDLDYENLTFTREEIDKLLHFLASDNGSISFADLFGGSRSMGLTEVGGDDDNPMNALFAAMGAIEGGLQDSKDKEEAKKGNSGGSDVDLLFNLRTNVLDRVKNGEGAFSSDGEFGAIHRKNFGELGCDPSVDRPCFQGDYVSCIETATDIYGNPMYSCACDFLHTQIEPLPGKPPCAKNVNTKCTNGHRKFQCGENMECLPDIMELDTDSYCYCKEGFAPAKNAIGILGLCRPILQDNETEEEKEDYSESHAPIPAGRHCLPVLLFISLAAIGLFVGEN